MSSKGAGLIKTVFNTDNVVMRISEKVLDLVTVNLLFVLSCLPVLTIGIAKISLYQTLFAIKHQRRVPVIRSYAKAFRDIGNRLATRKFRTDCCRYLSL